MVRMKRKGLSLITALGVFTIYSDFQVDRINGTRYTGV